MRLIYGIIIGFILAAITAHAGIINMPPPLPESEVYLQQYLFDIRENMNRPTIVTSDPNTSRNGRKGQMVLFNDSETYKIFVNTDGAKAWQQTTQL